MKPAAGLVRGPKGIAQPGLKVRGPEYLRIIYGPDYTVAGNLARLRSRSVGRKRSLALREYALGLEALDRVARGRAVVAGPRVRVRRPGPGVRASRPAVCKGAGQRSAGPSHFWTLGGSQAASRSSRAAGSGVDDEHVAVLGADEARLDRAVEHRRAAGRRSP